MPITPIRAPRLDTGDPAAKREEIRAYFHATWETYERLFDGHGRRRGLRTAGPIPCAIR